MENLADQPSVPIGPPASSPAASSGNSGPFMHKNQLQEFTQRSSMPLPVYVTSKEGPKRAPKFMSSVEVNVVIYISGNTFSSIKAAEEDVAKFVMEVISEKIKDEGCPLTHMVTVCQTCGGGRGSEVALIYCDKCQANTVHRYYLSKLPKTSDEHVVWLCIDCEPRSVKLSEDSFIPLSPLSETGSNDFGYSNS